MHESESEANTKVKVKLIEKPKPNHDRIELHSWEKKEKRWL